jgi:predicted small secreted protein
MKKFVLNAIAFLVLATTTTACTYNVSMAHTSGMAEDVIDDTASNTPNVSPTVTVPMTPGSSVQVDKK